MELFDVAVADALAVVVAAVVVEALVAEECVADALVVAFFVVAAFVLLVATGVAAAAELTAAGVLAGAPIAPPPAKFNELVDDNCGGVTASTAPRPPKVPPAINNARFISASISYRSNASNAYEVYLTAAT